MSKIIIVETPEDCPFREETHIKGKYNCRWYGGYYGTCNRKRTFPKYCCLDDEVEND